MAPGTTATCVGENKSQWKLDNRRAVQKNHEGIRWARKGSRAFDEWRAAAAIATSTAEAPAPAPEPAEVSSSPAPAPAPAPATAPAPVIPGVMTGKQQQQHAKRLKSLQLAIKEAQQGGPQAGKAAKLRRLMAELQEAQRVVLQQRQVRATRFGGSLATCDRADCAW